MRHISFAADFSLRVLLQQPLRIAAAIGTDSIKLFSLRRLTYPGDPSIARWQFQRDYPVYRPYITVRDGQLHFNRLTPAGRVKLIARGQRFGGGEPAVSPRLAAFLRGYQLHGGYTPGPLFLLSVLAGLVGSLGVLRRRASPAQRATAAACLLTFLSAVAVLLASDAFEFSWRYQLPALVTLPPAGALGITVIVGYLAARRARRPPPGRRRADRPAGPGPPGRAGPAGRAAPDPAIGPAGRAAWYRPADRGGRPGRSPAAAVHPRGRRQPPGAGRRPRTGRPGLARAPAKQTASRPASLSGPARPRLISPGPPAGSPDSDSPRPNGRGPSSGPGSGPGSGPSRAGARTGLTRTTRQEPAGPG